MLRAANLCAALIAAAMFSAAAAADDPASLAEQAITVIYEAETLAYEKDLAERTVKGNMRRIESTEKNLPKLKEAAEKAKRGRQAAEEELTKREAAASEAKSKAEKSGDDGDKAAADKAEKERVDSEKLFRQAESTYKREADRLERAETQLRELREESSAAQKAIPDKETAAKAATKRAETLRERVQGANKEHAATQDPQAVARKIDELINARLKSEGVPASPPADDAEYLRRLTLDISGAVPKYEDVLTFLTEESVDKRSALVERLLSDPTYGRNFAQRFCTLTTEEGTSTLNQGQEYFNDWLAESLQLNRRWDRIATDMLATDGFGYQEPGALFTVAYRMNEQPDPALLVGAAGDFFLGLQVKCAQCHDHPYHEWSQDQFWGLAAMFGRVRLKGQSNNGRELEYLVTDDDVDPKEMVRMNGIKYPEQLPGGKIAIPDPVDPDKIIKTIAAEFLDGESPELPETGNYRTDFADWVTAKENPYFARATVNRLWAHFFGRGIVEPIDNLHPDNKPTHPEVLTLLTTEFQNSDYDLQFIIRCIAQTRAYARTSKPVDGNEDDQELFSHMAVKPLDSYAMVDSLWVALNRTPPEGSRRRDAAAVFDTRLPGGDPTKYTHSIPQVLKMMNSKDHVQANAVQSVTRGKSAEVAIEHLYLMVLARPPADAEREEMLAYVEELGDQSQGYADIYWVLLNSAEFSVNH